MLRVKCLRHVRYSGATSPRAACEQCIAIRDLRFRALAARLNVEPNEAAGTSSEG